MCNYLIKNKHVFKEDKVIVESEKNTVSAENAQTDAEIIDVDIEEGKQEEDNSAK